MRKPAPNAKTKRIHAKSSGKTPRKNPRTLADTPLVLAAKVVPQESFLSDTKRAQYEATTAMYDAVFEDAARVAEQEIYAIEDWPTSKAVVASRVMAAIRRLKLS